jgi:hypothetical protein
MAGLDEWRVKCLHGGQITVRTASQRGKTGNRNMHRTMWLVLSALVPIGARAVEIYDRFPDSIHASERYVIYSHGMIVEGDDLKPVSPKYEQYDFPAIKQSLFRDGGFNLIAFQRPKSSDDSYADTLKSWVRRLLDSGVKPQILD